MRPAGIGAGAHEAPMTSDTDRPPLRRRGSPGGDADRHVVVTGASSGIGAAIAIELSRRGYRALAIGRNPARLEWVHSRMTRVAPRHTSVPAPVVADLAKISEIQRVSNHILRECELLHAVVNNAGIQPTRRRTTPDGFEETLMVNHLAPFLLTTLLLPRLTAHQGQVITTSSSNHEKASIDFDDLQLTRGWHSMRAYNRSKLANILFTYELRQRTSLPATAFHPGSIRTNLNRESRLFRLTKPIEYLVYGSPAKGAQTPVWLVSSGEGASPSALYYAERAPAKPAPQALDPVAAARLWDESVSLLASRGAFSPAAH
jgi:NAD(P)-dependent dehydrogenase (short-subunit alcohol dehydrogenase family)